MPEYASAHVVSRLSEQALRIIVAGDLRSQFPVLSVCFLLRCSLFVSVLPPSPPPTRYSVNRKVVEKVDMPFPKDADDVPGRTKMKGRSVQRPPRPEGEVEEEVEQRESENQEEGGLL